MQKYLTIVSVLLCASLGWSQVENSWEKKASFGGMKREKAIAFTIDNLGYVGTGVDTAEMTHNDLWSYDPELDTWTQLASMPAPERRNAIAFAIDGKGYVGTGLTADDGDFGVKLKDFWEYNPLDNSWDAKADYPGGGDTGLYYGTAFAIAGQGYLACGKIGPDAYIPEMWSYNPVSDAWTPKTPFPGGDRYQLISFVIQNRAYVGMGTDHDVFRKDIYEYNSTTNTWEDATHFPGTERAKASAFSIGNKGFVIFGTDGGLKDELWEYNYFSETWIPRSDFPGGGRNHCVAFSIGATGYAGMGKGVSGKKQSFYAYTPTGPLSIDEQTLVEFKVYPNPIRDNSQVILPEKLNEGSYFIQNMGGKIVAKNSFNQSQFMLSKGQLATGYYQLVILDNNNYPVGVKKIAVL